MADKRLHDFSVLLRFPGKESLKIMFYSAALWPGQGGREGLWRLKLATPVDTSTGTFSEGWYPAPHQYEFLTPAKAWELVRKWSGQNLAGPKRLPDIPPKTKVRVFNGNRIAGEKQYDLTWTTTEPVRLSDGRGYVVVMMPGKGNVHVPLDDIELIGGRK
jgi:hypothetical protein